MSSSKVGVGERGPKKNLASQLLIAQAGGKALLTIPPIHLKKTNITGIIDIKYE